MKFWTTDLVHGYPNYSPPQPDHFPGHRDGLQLRASLGPKANGLQEICVEHGVVFQMFPDEFRRYDMSWYVTYYVLETNREIRLRHGVLAELIKMTTDMDTHGFRVRQQVDRDTMMMCSNRLQNSQRVRCHYKGLQSQNSTSPRFMNHIYYTHNIKDDRKKVPLFAAGIYMYQLLRGLRSLYREGVVPNRTKLGEPIRFKTWQNSRCG